jgi:SRSO17 transposase
MPLSAPTESIFEFRRFVRRYQSLFRHSAQRRHFEAYLRGLIGPLERKSIEPIALDQGVNWRSLQDFIGCAPWDAEILLTEHRRHVRETLGRPGGIIILDPTSYPKRGDKTVGVARQWCGQLGKEENCVVGINVGYSSEKGHAPIDRRLYLPADWANNLPGRRAAGVPDNVVFRTSWELSYEMISQARGDRFPHSWVIGDEEFGKVPLFQDWLREDGERYIFEVPCSHRVWVTLPRRDMRGQKRYLERLQHFGPGRPRLVRMDQLIQRLPPRAWAVHDVRDASKGPIRVRAVLLRVQFHRRKNKERPEGWLLMTQSIGQCLQTKYFQSNAEQQTPKEELLQVAYARWPVEQCHGQGKNETGLGDYETRSWRGWHHHTALSFLAQHWLVMERNRLGEKISRDDGRRGPTTVLRRGPDRSRTSSTPGSTDAAPAAPKPKRPPITLAESARESARSRATQTRS